MKTKNVRVTIPADVYEVLSLLKTGSVCYTMGHLVAAAIRAYCQLPAGPKDRHVRALVNNSRLFPSVWDPVTNQIEQYLLFVLRTADQVEERN